MRERRFSKKRMARRVFLVICEGDTEETYVEALKQHFRLPIAIKTKVSGNKINARLVAQYIKELGLAKDDDYQVFYIYDSDIDCVVEKVRALPGICVLSNPCIELWYMLHHAECRRPLDSANMLNVFSSSLHIWKTYLKWRLSNEQMRHLIENRGFAAERAAKLRWPDNPSSNMGVFIEAVENAKMS